MSLSGYDQVLFEDHSTNCLEESLELFRRTASQQVLAETDFIVFLNKNGLFACLRDTIASNNRQWIVMLLLLFVLCIFFHD